MTKSLDIIFVDKNKYDDKTRKAIIEDFNNKLPYPFIHTLEKVLKEKISENHLPTKGRDMIFFYDFSKGAEKLRLFFVFFNGIRLGGFVNKKGEILNLSEKKEILLKEWLS